jgi:hypothetical protein
VILIYSSLGRHRTIWRYNTLTNDKEGPKVNRYCKFIVQIEDFTTRWIDQTWAVNLKFHLFSYSFIDHNQYLSGRAPRLFFYSYYTATLAQIPQHPASNPNTFCLQAVTLISSTARLAILPGIFNRSLPVDRLDLPYCLEKSCNPCSIFSHNIV